MKRLILSFTILFSVTCFAQELLLYLGEVKIILDNMQEGDSYYIQSSKVENTSHWDFNNNLVINNDYTGQTVQIDDTTNPVAYLYWRRGKTNGMGKGLYRIYAKNSSGYVLAFFIYDTRTSKSYSGSPDLVVHFNCNSNTFLYEGDNINYTTLTIWDYVPALCCEQETDKFQPTAPINLDVYPLSGHPFLSWNNNYISDYWTAIDVYRYAYYNGPPQGFDLIASLGPASTTYMDTRYDFGQGGIAYYKVKKRNFYKSSQFSNMDSVSIIPQKINQEQLFENPNSLDPIYDNYLYQNYPNPFNPTTTINFSIKESGYVSIKLYDLLGKEISTISEKFYNKGLNTLILEASNIATGIYVYILSTKNLRIAKKLSIIK